MLKKNPVFWNSRVTPKPLTEEEAEKDARERLALINKEFSEGFDFIKQYPKSVTIFGSAVIKESDPYYKKAERIAAKLALLGYAVVTGGGPGIMEAANKGAFEAGGESIGLNIKLPSEQKPNRYLTNTYEFYYFFSRKVALSFAAEAYLFFPGGFGTLNEFFEIVTLIQTSRISPVPVILVGTDFWHPLSSLIKDTLLATYKTIDKEDTGIFYITDDDEDIVKKIGDAPIVDAVPFIKPATHNGKPLNLEE
jgi:uncharacterized protein (TIGR00730 family)